MIDFEVFNETRSRSLTSMGLPVRHTTRVLPVDPIRSRIPDARVRCGQSTMHAGVSRVR